MKILCLEDDADLRECLIELLSSEGYAAKGVVKAEDFMSELASFVPDIVLLDQVLPGRNGIDVLKEIRSNAKYHRLPVVMVTGESEEKFMASAFDFGVDDYVVKPFTSPILIKRLNALARRCGLLDGTPRRLEKDQIVLNIDEHRVTIGDQTLSLTLTEFNILRELFKESGRILSREKLLDRALGTVNVTNRTIDVHVCSLRKKLQEHGKTIETVRGVGYRLSA